MKKFLILIGLLLFNFAYAQIDQIKIGAYVNDIQNLDLKSHSYTMDLYIWFKWKNKDIDPSSSIEFMNSFDQWGHTVTKSYEKPKELENGEMYQVMRVQGRFSYKFNLRDYPFDRQKLLVSFEDSELETHQAQYVLDEPNPIAINPEIIFPGFDLRSPKIYIKKISHPTTFGDPNLSNEAKYDRVQIEVPIVRPFLTYSVKLLLPVLCVVFCATLMFLFSPNYIESRVGIGITAILTVVALQITLGSELPEIDYLVLIDKIYLITYVFIVCGLFVVLKGSWDLEKEKKSVEAINKTDKMFLYILTSAYIVIATFMILLTIY